MLDSILREIALNFPKSIKTFFENIDHKFPNSLNLPNPKSKLNFVEVELGLQSKKCPKAKIMIDSGCSHSCISLNVFNRIKNNTRYILCEGETSLHTPSSTSITAITRVIIPFRMTDSKNQVHQLAYPFYVTSTELPNDGYLGIDFLLQSSFCQGIHNNHINLIEPRSRKSIVHIPIQCLTTAESINLLTCEEIFLLPKQIASIPAYSVDNVPESFSLLIEDDSNSQQVDDITIIPSLAEKTSNDIYQIFVKNNSKSPMNLKKHSQIAKISIDTLAQNHFQIMPDTLNNKYSLQQPCHNHLRYKKRWHTPKPLRLNSITANINASDINDNPSILDLNQLERDNRARIQTKEKLDKDITLSEEEKTVKFQQYEDKGYYTHSPTTILDKNIGLMELKQDSQKIVDDDQLLSEINVSHLPKSEQTKIIEIFRNNISVLSRSELDVGQSPDIIADVELTPEAKSKCQNCKFIPINPTIRDEIDTMLDNMVKAGILRYTKEASNITSNLLITKKRTGAWRILLDSRLLNNSVIKKQYYPESLQTIFQDFHNSTYITQVDLSNSYWSIGLQKEIQPIFSFFNSRGRRLCYQTLSQGFINSAYFLNQLCLKIRETNPELTFYADDLYLITKSNFSDHCNKLHKLLETLSKMNLKIKGKKVIPATEILDVLGHNFNKGRFEIPEAKLSGILNWKTPKSASDVNIFVGHISFFHHYVPHYATITQPLQEIANQAKETTRKRNVAKGTKEKIITPKFIWTKEANDSFVNIKQAIKEANTKYPADPKLPFYAYSDASKIATSFILTQKDSEGNHKLVGASSRLFHKAEKNYSVFKKELISVINGLDTFKQLLSFSKIHLTIDAKAIMFLRSCKGSDPLIERCSLILSNHDITITHVSSEQNYLADSMSRNQKDDELNTNDNFPPMSQQDCTRILKQMTLPDSFTIDEDLFKKYAIGDGLNSPIKSKKKEKTTKATITNKTLSPPKKSTRKIKMPATTPTHIFYRNQREQLYNQTPSFLNQSRINNIRIKQPKNENSKKNTSDIQRKINRYITKSFLLHHIEANCDNYDRRENLRLTHKIYTDGIISIPTLREAQELDPFCVKIKQNLQKHPLFFIKQGILIKKHIGEVNTKELIVLPKSLLPLIKHSLHFSPISNHPSATSTYKLMKDTYYYPSLYNVLKNTTSGCFMCNTQKPTKGKQLSFGEKHYPKLPRKGYAFDILGGLPAVRGYSYVYCYVDMFSGYTILIPAKTKSAEELLLSLKQGVIKYFDFPSIIYSDSESGMLSHQMKAFCEAHNIELQTTSAHSPQSNGLCEKLIGLCKEQLRLLSKSQGESWLDMLFYANNALNRRRLTTGLTPQIIGLGNDSQTTAILKEEATYQTPGDYVRFMNDSLDIAYNHRNAERKKLADKNRRHMNKRRTEKSFQLRQLVTLKNNEIAQVGGGAIKDRYFGIYEIIHLNEKEKTCILKHIDHGGERGAHLRHLIPLNEIDNEYPIPIRNEATRLLNRQESINTNRLSVPKQAYNLRPRN